MYSHVNHADLSGMAPHLDAALYQASVLCAASADKTARIYVTTQPEVADAETGERYLVFRGSDAAQSYLRADQGWRLCYTIKAEG